MLDSIEHEKPVDMARKHAKLKSLLQIMQIKAH